MIRLTWYIFKKKNTVSCAAKEKRLKLINITSVPAKNLVITTIFVPEKSIVLLNKKLDSEPEIVFVARRIYALVRTKSNYIT